MKDKQIYSEYILYQEEEWFNIFQKYIEKRDVLKIGNGFGHLSERIRPLTNSLQIVDIINVKDSINKELVTLYDGEKLPFTDKVFDTTIIIFTLHHIKNSEEYFKEIMRVTKKRIIILEETYNNVFSKIHLFFRDWLVNRVSGQSCTLYWSSYFSRKRFNNLIKKYNLSEVYRLTRKHETYYKELLVLDLLN